MKRRLTFWLKPRGNLSPHSIPDSFTGLGFEIRPRSAFRIIYSEADGNGIIDLPYLGRSAQCTAINRSATPMLIRPAPRRFGIGRTVLVNVPDAGLGFYVDVRIGRVFARDARANFQHHCGLRAAVLETVPVGIAGLVPGAVAGAQQLLAGV